MSAAVPPKPDLLVVDREFIPAELRALLAWVGWKLTYIRQRWTKTPIDLKTGGLAASDDPTTWTSFDHAVTNYRVQGCDGIGLCRTSNLVFIDLDGVLDGAGNLKPYPWAIRILSVISGKAYIEKSVTGTGLHAVCRGSLTPGRRQFDEPGMDHTGFALYDGARFFTFSGQVLPESGSICDLAEALTKLHIKLFPPQATSPNGNDHHVPHATVSFDLSDEEILARARRAANGDGFARLFDGDITGYASQSEADLALCCHLAFWTCRDAGRIDNLFRRSGLCREKWTEQKGYYRQRTIEAALAKTSDVYDPDRNGHHAAAPTGGDGGCQSADDEPRQDSAPINWGASWPKPLQPEAYYGLAGDIVRVIEPHTEGDTAAILSQLLVGFGNMIGRSPYYRVGADRHYPNLFTVLVGNTSRGRKGSSWNMVSSILESCDSGWSRTRVQSGLSSGEGLIWAVRDPLEEQEPIREQKTKRVLEYQTVVTDPGISDKRLLVTEPEFARVLQVADRESNTLSAVLRQSWDSGNLSVMTRNRPAMATAAHISIIGHITKDELLKTLNSTEAANGFGNRILWICVQRSKRLPDGGEFHKVNVAPILRRLEDALRFAGAAGELTRDEEAGELWHDVYGQLTSDRFGMLGAVTSRAEAQTLRLSCLYALLDRSPRVCIRHLAAALELWRYCEDSAQFIFGQNLGDQTADLILSALRSNPFGMTREDINVRVFGRNKKADDIARALKVLIGYGLVRYETEETNGRPRERWYAVTEVRRA